MTLIEVIVTTAMIGLISAVVAAAITVIFRTEDGVTGSIAESHDARQGVNYIPLDVESGAYLVREFRATVGGFPGDTGSGCDEAVGQNDNILRIDLSDRRIAFRLAGDRLDRYVCVRNGGSWDEGEIVNIADTLDGTAPTVAQAEVVAKDATLPLDQQQVERVVVSLAHVGPDRVITASPRVEAPFSSAGTCGDDPLAAARNVDTFIEGDVHLDGTNVKSALAVGGALSWSGSNPQVASASVANHPEVYGPTDQTYLFVDRIDWAASSGTLRLQGSRQAVIRDQNYEGAPQGSNWRTFEIGNPGGPDLLSDVQPTADDPIDYGDAFVELQACSDLLASLPDACAGCAAFVTLETTSGGPYPGTAADDSPTLNIRNDVANVLNMTEQNLTDLAGGQLKLDPQNLDTDWPLVINVGTDSDVTFTPPAIQAGGSSPIYVIWNFPNAATITVTGHALYGTLFAPYADVTIDESVEGGVIARSFDMSGSSLNDVRSFAGEFNF